MFYNQNTSTFLLLFDSFLLLVLLTHFGHCQKKRSTELRFPFQKKSCPKWTFLCFRQLPSWTFTGTLKTVPSLLMVWPVSVWSHNTTGICVPQNLSLIIHPCTPLPQNSKLYPCFDIFISLLSFPIFITRCHQWHGDAGALWRVFWGNLCYSQCCLM